ncbi:hypothetical protein EXU85_12915 [Spirosoma sp. KCTC 42546]|uniref:hypothetical protein n=1 Tax=Spirosoma sp. KCTC 42546 TaxID=2520506 RepID=UPI00115B8E8E|nr:hypothetical protein [Spirosoma sp. KCTC 42546]QDK79454.1 hypothetical protein EXU85_12915 [Spirosoma sp. KCTC 42546]
MKTVLLLLLLSPVVLWAQVFKISPNDTQRKHSYVVMRDGSVVRGQVVRQDSTVITIRKGNGDMTFVEADQIIRISPNRPDDVVRTESYGANPTLYTVFVFKDGTQVEGDYVRRDNTMITVRKRNGQLTYFEPELLARVDTIRAGVTSADGVAADDGIFSNRFSPWLLTGQTAFTPEKGRFYYRNTLALRNEFDYGITRNWSVGASFVLPIPYLVLSDFYAFNGFLPANSHLFTKLSVPVGNQFRFALAVDYQDKLYPYINTRGALTYQALAAIGTSQRNVTLGFGLTDRGKRRYYQYLTPYSSVTPMDMPIPNQSFLTLGIMQKVLPGLTVISDNRINLGQNQAYYLDNLERASVSFALRFDRRRHAFDLGVYSLMYRDRDKWYDGRQVRILGYLGYNLIIGKP